MLRGETLCSWNPDFERVHLPVVAGISNRVQCVWFGGMLEKQQIEITATTRKKLLLE